ncbi:hypothetical protein T484DRAFT_1772007 [Baffinella frigidus]|nr:hypothetical protein T484DRAFT_1772007 [Cryptophyta sp. CCMP2293]
MGKLTRRASTVAMHSVAVGNLTHRASLPFPRPDVQEATMKDAAGPNDSC